MVGYTATVESMGEDRALPFTRALHDLLSKAVKEHGGSVRSFAGDSVMAVFGADSFHEDPALRACRAAVAIHAAFDAHGDEFAARYAVRPGMRVGISSGVAVMAPEAGGDAALSAVGTVVNLASRVQALAVEGRTLISDATRRQVEWQTDLSFGGEHAIKGVGRPQKLWWLRAVRPGVTRFDASIARGLSPLVGRESEMAVLTAALKDAHERRQLVDLVGEPGMGKTRLAFEFTQRAEAGGALVLTGHCSPDGRDVPFLPFLEVVRDAFRLRADHEPEEIVRNLEAGLRVSGLYSRQNLGLLQNLLGLKAQEGALSGLDGVLIGLKTRDLLPQLLWAQTKANPVVVLIEDLHWIDKMSEDLLTRLAEEEDKANLLILTTRRPETALAYAGLPDMKTLVLPPLAADDLQKLLRSRTGSVSLPDVLVAKVTDRAGGNPLFGEEILSLIIQQGTVHDTEGSNLADEGPIEGGLPASVQNLLTVRIDRLGTDERTLLQVAAVIGPRFDPGLLEMAMSNWPGDLGATLQRLQDLDLVRREANSSNYVFRHVLLRDTVYAGLLADRRQALHLVVAEALERRSGGRLPEVAETLAFHFLRAGLTRQAFTYAVMAGRKALGIYSLDLAAGFFEQAMSIYESDPACTTNDDVVAFLSDYGLCLNISMRVRPMLALAEKVGPILSRSGDSPQHIHFLHHLVVCLICSSNYFRSNDIRNEMREMAARLGDDDSRAYALASDIALSCHFEPYAPEVFDAKRQEAEALVAKLDDAYLRNYLFAYLGYDKICRGLVAEANDLAEQMIARGTALNDARSLGYGTAMKALSALCTDDYPTALRESEAALGVARVAWETAIAVCSRKASLIPLGLPGASEEVEGFLRESAENNWTMMSSGPEAMLGVAMVMQGRIGEGIMHLKKTIARRESEGARGAADWSRMYLCEVYVSILSGEGEKPPLPVLLRNFGVLMKVMIIGPVEIRAMLSSVQSNAHFAKNGHYIARSEMLIGLLCKARKQKYAAITHLSKALAIIEPAGQSTMRSRIENALSELGARSAVERQA
jgi:class 3 adenylate cyclase